MLLAACMFNVHVQCTCSIGFAIISVCMKETCSYCKQKLKEFPHQNTCKSVGVSIDNKALKLFVALLSMV